MIIQVKGKLRDVNWGGRGQIRDVFMSSFGRNGLRGQSLTGVQILWSQVGPFLGGLQCIQGFCIGECRVRGCGYRGPL